jgi:hypothetical protein
MHHAVLTLRYSHYCAMHCIEPVPVFSTVSLLSLRNSLQCSQLRRASQYTAASDTHTTAILLLPLLLLLPLTTATQKNFEITINPTNPADPQGALHYRVYCDKHAVAQTPPMVPPTAIRGVNGVLIPKVVTQDESRRLVSHLFKYRHFQRHFLHFKLQYLALTVGLVK